MKVFGFLLLFASLGHETIAQRFDSIYVNLYTDSLKKGTHNYINIEGVTVEGKVLPLDTNHVTFTSNAGTFFGNSLWIDSSYSSDRVTITVTLKERSPVNKTFVVFIKKNEDTGLLLTEDEIIRTPSKKSRKKD